MKKPLQKHHKTILFMLIMLLAFWLLDKPVGEPGQMYAAVIHTSNEKAGPKKRVTLALQNGVQVTFSNAEFTKGDKIKLWVKQTRFSRQRAFSLHPHFKHYVFAQHEY